MAWYNIFSVFRSGGGPTRTSGVQISEPLSRTASPIETVNFDTAMQVSAFWAAARILTETFGSMNFEMLDKSTNKPVDTDLRNILKYNPNQYMTPVEFWEMMQLNLCTTGNAYAIKQTAGQRIVGLLPVSSSQVETRLVDGGIVHLYTDGENVEAYSADSIWHVKLFGNGIVGLSPLAYAANALGIAMATDKNVGSIMANGAKPAGVLMLDKMLTPEQRNSIRSEFAFLREGTDNKLAVLEKNMQYQQVSMLPKDIQLEEMRRFQVEEVGRYMGVPSVLMNQTFGQSSLGSNVYEIMNGFYKINMRPYLEKYESSITRWLLPESERDNIVVKFDFDSLLRADRESRIAANAQAIQSCQLTPNEARASEGNPPMEGGDKLFIQSGTVPVDETQTPTD